MKTKIEALDKALEMLSETIRATVHKCMVTRDVLLLEEFFKQRDAYDAVRGALDAARKLQSQNKRRLS